MYYKEEEVIDGKQVFLEFIIAESGFLPIQTLCQMGDILFCVGVDGQIQAWKRTMLRRE